jgi:sphinganine C4-monooxygenase
MTTMSAPSNATLLSIMTPSVVHTPVYFVTGPSLLPSLITDKHLSLAAPIVCYWAYSLMFHAIDCAGIPYFEKRRIHEAPEVLSRNRATVWDVLKAVAIQQIIQTLLGYFWLESEEVILAREVYRDFLADMAALVPGVMKTTTVLLGKRTGEQLLRSYGADIVQWVYWWGIPTAQFAFAL